MTNKEIRQHLNDQIDHVLLNQVEMWDSNFKGFIFKLPEPMKLTYRIYIREEKRFDKGFIVNRLEGFRKRVESIGAKAAVKNANTHRINAGVSL